jgi:hypothetical protein
MTIFSLTTLAHCIYICTGTEIGRDWYMFDVGGVRTSVSSASFLLTKYSLTSLPALASCLVSFF